MARKVEHNDKSKTALTVDSEQPNLPSPPEVAERAYQLWVRKGRPPNSAEEDWLEAERELHDAVLSRRLVQVAHNKSGSVQS